MAKNQNTFAKRKREMDKKLKAEAKRERRKKRREAAENGETSIILTGFEDEAGDAADGEEETNAEAD